ncbi:MAG: creatininase family protein [Thermodesulfobacteriota bacterium]
MQGIELITSKEFERMRDETDLAIIPVGAIEIYGPHLPLGTDSIVAERIAQRVASRVKCFFIPVIPIGYSWGLMEYPGTLTVKPRTLEVYLGEVCDSLIYWGIRRILFLNTHLGNVQSINVIAEEIQRKHRVRCAQVDWWRFVKWQSEGIVETGELAHGHASETATSIMLYLLPEVVNLECVKESSPHIKDNFPDVIQYPNFKSITETGTVGNPTVATAEKGEAIVERSVNRIVDFIECGFLPFPKD